MQTVKEDRLQKMFIQVNKMFSEEIYYKFMIGNEPTFTKFVMDNINGMCWNMHSWVWSKRPDRKEVIIGLAMVPKNWFQHLKFDLFEKYPKVDRFLSKILHPKIRYYFIVKMKTIEIKRTIELQTFYPTIKILNHEPYLNVVEVNNASEGFD